MAKMTVHLDPAEIKNLQQYIRNRHRTLEQELADLRLQIAERIKAAIQANVNGSILDDTFYTYTKGQSRGIDTGPIMGTSADVTVDIQTSGSNVTVIVVSGDDIVWLEFGAGVHYNNGDPNPTYRGVVPGIVGIGQYGKGKGMNDSWMFTKNGERYRTHGTPASMPIYHAVQDSAQYIIDSIRSVFPNA